MAINNYVRFRRVTIGILFNSKFTLEMDGNASPVIILPSRTFNLRRERLTLTGATNLGRFAPPFATLLQQLRQIWQLADADGDSKLSLAEFCVGMHLIVCVSKKGLPCPATRPQSLSAGSDSTLVASSAQVLGGSPAKPVPQSPIVRPSPAMQPPSPSSAMLPLGAVASSSDAFNAFRSVNIGAQLTYVFVVCSVCMVLCLWFSTPVLACLVWYGDKMLSSCCGLGGYFARS